MAPGVQSSLRQFPVFFFNTTGPYDVDFYIFGVGTLTFQA